MGSILIVEDEFQYCHFLEKTIAEMGHDVVSADALAKAIAIVSKHDLDLILLDVQLPDGNGIAAVKQFKQAPSCPEVIIMTGTEDESGAELAIRNGAWNYLQKPISNKNLRLQMERALAYRSEKQSNPQVRSLKRDAIVGSSAVMAECLDQVAHCANNHLPVLITGETGTGKELFARTIHDNSSRHRKPFIVVDCAALPEHLVESILFGHEKGAFTGADCNRPGLIKAASGGTLFLDEIGELPLSIQKRFLRVLQEQKFRPVGSTKEIESHFHLISATNRNLSTMVKNGAFREDLLYRLKTIHLELPALRDRKDDIPDMVTYFVNRACRQVGCGPKAVVPEVFDILKSHDWPGNVRELKNAVELAVGAQNHGDMLFPISLPDHLRVRHIQSHWTNQDQGSPPVRQDRSGSMQLYWTPPFNKVDILPFKEMREAITVQMEQTYLSHLVRMLQGDFRQISKYSGLGRSRLYHLLNKHDISLS